MRVLADSCESTNIFQTSLSPNFFLHCPLRASDHHIKLSLLSIFLSGLGCLLEWLVVAFLLTTALNHHPRVGWWQVLPMTLHSSSDDFKTIHETLGSNTGNIPRHTCEGKKENSIHLCVRLRFFRTVVPNSKCSISTSGLPYNSSFSRFVYGNYNRKLHSLLKIWSDTYYWFLSIEKPGCNFQFLRFLWCRRESPSSSIS